LPGAELVKLMYDLPNVKRLHIELSSKCNASCPACSRNISGGPVSPNLVLAELTLADIKRMIPPDFARRITSINYCGNLGDPGTATELIDILKYFRSTNPLVVQQIRTNGGMRGEKFWKEVGEFFAKQHKVTDSHMFSRAGVVFSVDGLADTNHIYRRGVIWDKLYSNMQAYASTGAFGIWEWLVFQHNHDQIPQAEEMAKELGLVFVVKNPMGFGDYTDKQTGMRVYDKQGNYDYTIYPVNFKGQVDSDNLKGTKVDFTYSATINRETRPEITDFSRELVATTKINCKAIEHSHSQEIYISSSGHLLPCCFLGGVFGQFNNTYSQYQFNSMINNYGLDHFDLRQHTIPEILSKPEFSNFFLQGWDAPDIESGKLLYCAEVCGKCSAIDKLYNSKEIK
jgi:MoaA/NifB/PqqE/SkfB family radical SAM enzyme